MSEKIEAQGKGIIVSPTYKTFLQRFRWLIALLSLILLAGIGAGGYWAWKILHKPAPPPVYVAPSPPKSLDSVIPPNQPPAAAP
jgi:hypothetical protein